MRDRQKLHERTLVDDLVTQLRREGHNVADVTYDLKPAPGGRAVVDALPTAIEVGCGYADDPKELWRQEYLEVENPYMSSSSNAMLTERRRVPGSRLPVLVGSLQARLEDKCRHRHGRSYLILDASHDELAKTVGVEALVSRLRIPPDCGFRAIYLVEPRFEQPRRYVLIHGAA